jgi:hypothetical protein
MGMEVTSDCVVERKAAKVYVKNPEKDTMVS